MHCTALISLKNVQFQWHYIPAFTSCDCIDEFLSSTSTHLGSMQSYFSGCEFSFSFCFCSNSFRHFPVDNIKTIANVDSLFKRIFIENVMKGDNGK